MAITQISKIQVRTGNSTDLPVLSSGEFGYATDTHRLYIGNPGAVLPTDNTEVGASGYSGISGYSSYSGYSGVSGFTGPSNTINATDDTTTTALYPVMVGAAGSNQTAKATTTKLAFNASTGTLDTTYVTESVNTGVSAAGSTQGTATLLASAINEVSTVASGAGVKLPVAVAGMKLYIINNGANSLSVYPNTGAAINSGAANAAFAQGSGATLHFIAISSTQWYTVGATYS